MGSPVSRSFRHLRGPLAGQDSGSHAIPWTHADQVNTALLGFLRR